MGLYAAFGRPEGMFPSVLSAEVDGDVYEVEVDYSYAWEVMEETFLDVANDLVPVDTGYLQSTIDFESDYDTYAEFYVYAEYAQYVEYGTWKMDEQPYFRPAIEEAMEAFIDEAQMAKDEAEEELESMLSSVQEAFISAFGGGSSFGGFMMGNLAFAGLAFLFFPLLVYAYGILDTIHTAFGGSSDSDFGSGLGGLMP